MFKPFISLLCIVICLASVMFGMIAWISPVRGPEATLQWTVRIAACVLGLTSLLVLFVLAWNAKPVDDSRPKDEVTKYDDASWHHAGDYPDDLPPENAATHIGMFLAWLIERGLVHPVREVDSLDEVAKVRNRTMTGAEFLMDECDGKLMEEDLNDTGNAFAAEYYAEQYLIEWAGLFIDDGETLYHVEDTWRNYDRLKPILDKAFDDWRSEKRS